MKLPRIASIFALGLGFAAAPAFADANYNFSLGPTSTSGGNTVFNYSGTNNVTLIASGFNVTGNSPTALFTKDPSNGPDESGLGTVVDTPDHEITDDQFVQLNVTNLMAQGYTSLTIDLGSLQQGEDGVISYGSAAGSLTNPILATLVGTPLTQSYTVNFVSGMDFIDITGAGPNAGGEDSGDIVIEAATAHSVPDGGTTLAMLGGALATLATLRRRLAR
jgi:VPDSG-CTERM motif